MVIKLLANQVPMLWDAIKYAVAKSEHMSDKDLPLYLNRLLASLLNDQAQCFVRMDDQKQLLAIAITRFVSDEITGERTLFWNHLYSFQLVTGDQWETDWPLIVKFAKQNKCKKITLYTNNHRVIELASSRGFTERYKCLMVEV